MSQRPDGAGVFARNKYLSCGIASSSDLAQVRVQLLKLLLWCTRFQRSNYCLPPKLCKRTVAQLLREVPRRRKDSHFWSNALLVAPIEPFRCIEDIRPPRRTAAKTCY